MTAYVATHDHQTIQGGDGSDVITIAPFLGIGDTVLNGGGGDDVIDSSFGHDTTLNGQDGSDLLKGRDGDHIIGGAGTDTTILDLTGTDTAVTANLSGLGTSATVGISNATLATVEIALIALGDGDDHVTSSAKAQVAISGGDGDDVLAGKGGIDLLAGGSGSDLVKGGGESDVLYGYAPDQIFGFDVPGVGSDDASGHDTLLGGAGADLLTGSLGDDRIDGGADLDTVSYDNAPGGVSIDLHHAKQHTGSAGVDTLISIENVIGSAGADHIVGDDSTNILSGGGGADTIEGGDGSDVLSGGAGADVFVFSAAHDSGDAIVDLSSEDLIDLSRIDADTGKAGDQAFHIVDHLSGHAGELMVTYDSHTDTTLVAGDTNGDLLPDFGVALNGDQTGFAGWVL